MNREGFREAPKTRGEGKLRQEYEKRVTQGKLNEQMQVIFQNFQQHGRVLNDASVRIDALQKSLVDAGVITMDAVQFNQRSLKGVQQFVINELANPDKPMLERVRAAVKFNATQPPDFRVTESYFPVRKWLTMNEENMDGEEIAQICGSFCLDVPKVFVEERLLAVARRAAKELATS
jgi:hypothetical protein